MNPSIFELDHNKNKELLDNKVIELSLLLLAMIKSALALDAQVALLINVI